MADTPPAAKRTFYIPTTEINEVGGRYETTDYAEHWLGQMLATLMAVGGTLVIQSDRAKVGMLGDEPLAMTQALVASWTSQAGKLREIGAAPAHEDHEPAVEPGEGD